MLRILSSMSLCVLLASSAAAQPGSQTALVGTVTDTDGLAVPGVAVEAVNEGTKDTYQAVTNGEGYYNIQFVRTGRYEISATLQGFQTFRTTGVEVTTNQVVRTNIVLRVGALQETTNVVARAAVIATDSAVVAQSVNQRAISELPVSNRDVFSLASTTPAVTPHSEGQFVGAGQRGIQNSLSLDGIDAMMIRRPAGSLAPIADAVTEVEVRTGSMSAEYGSYLGVQVNVVTKGGSNKPHGATAYFFQDSSLDARGFFEDRSRPQDPRQRKQYSFQADGPVVIPGLYNGRDRTFFMGAIEGIQADTQSTAFATVPTALMRQGNFSEVSQVIRNPFTRQPYPGNIIPASEISPVSLRYLNYYELPNQPGLAANLRANPSSRERTNQFLARVDQNLGNKVRVYARYNWQDEDETSKGTIPYNGTAGTPRTQSNLLVAYTHTLKPNLLNDFRVGYHDMTFNDLNYFYLNGLTTAGSDLGIPGFDGDVRYNNPGLPGLSISGFSGIGGGTNWYNDSHTFQISNVLSYNRGSHNVRAGVSSLRLSYGRQAANDPRGLFAFNGQMTGHAVADFMLGLPREVRTPLAQLQGDIVGFRNGFFVNDTWQTTRNLTLNLGLRYELNTPVKTTSGYASMLNEDQTALVPETHPTPGFKFHKSNLKDIAPRLGMTYRLTEKTVVRSGFGLYYNPNQFNTFSFLTNNPPLSPQFNFFSQPANPTLSFENPFGEVGPGAPPMVITPTWDLPNARKDQWSLDLQRELWPGAALNVQYVGSRTVDLDFSFFNNTPLPGPGAIQDRRPNPNYGVIRTIANTLSSNYHGVSVIFLKRMSAGLQFTAHYTWSRTRDEGDNSNADQSPGVNPYTHAEDNYGPAVWDIPHRFVASYVYELPFFRDSKPLVESFLGGWQISGVTLLESGRPFTVTIAGDVANTGIGSQRPDLVGTASANCGRDHLVNCIDPTAFAQPAPFTYGNAPRNLLRGPGQIVTDLSLGKSFRIGRQARVQVRGDFFNVFNTVNLNNPASVFGTATFGQITSARSMRRTQLGLRFTF